MTKQLFNKQDIQEILNKASVIQTQKDLYGDREGLTQDELIELAKDLGIDKESLLQAIQQKDIPEFQNTFDWLKGTSNIQDVQLMEGEISDENWDDVVQQLRTSLGGVGEISKSGKTFEWTQRFKDIGFRQISLSPHNGKVRVQYSYRWTGLKFITGFFSFMAIFAVFTIALDGSSLPSALTLLLSFIGGGLGSLLNRLYLKPYFEKKKKTMHRVMQELTSTLSTKNQGSIHIESTDIYSSNEESNPDLSTKTTT